MLALLFPSLAFPSEVDSLLLDTSVKLVKDVSFLKKQVLKLQEENRELRRALLELRKEVDSLKTAVRLSSSSPSSPPTSEKFRKIIVGTFLKEPLAVRFLSSLQEKTKLKAYLKKGRCRFGECFVVFVQGDLQTLEYLRKQGYKDAFLSKSDI